MRSGDYSVSDILEVRRRATEELGIADRLHDVQWGGVEFLYRSRSALVADEMGLGKTVQTIVALAVVLDERNGIDRVLIVAPASLTLNWMVELAEWAPSVVARRVQGGVEDRRAFYMLPVPVLVASYEQIREDGLERIPADTFDLVVVDEAQRIKNRNSATSLACRLLPRRRAWALSATPLENEPDDVASLLDFLEPEPGRRLSRVGMEKKLETVMLRRRKRDVRAELPSVIIQDLQLELSARQRERYEELWATRETAEWDQSVGSDAVAEMLGLITRLKSICNFDPDSGGSTKLEALTSLMDAAGDGARIIVFSQFVKTLRWISERLDMPHDMLIGSMSQAQRGAAIKEFKTESAPRALLISLRAGGVGLNLGEASHVVLFDRWWNPAAEVQAVYRAHRFNREESLHVIRFLVRDSIEERIAGILERKESLFAEIIDSVGVRPPGPTKRELMEILELPHGSTWMGTTS